MLHIFIPSYTGILKRFVEAGGRLAARCAAGLANMSSTSSLAELLENTIGVSLEKTETRTDWVQRPLSEEQLAYAIDDVCYMHEVRDVLIKRVEEIGRSEWLAEELATYDKPSLYEDRDPREQYQRVKGAGRASPREFAVLREVAAWREHEARRRDRPRSHVLTDETLVFLARRKPQAIEDLAQTRGINAQRDGERILEQIRMGLEIPDNECPRRPRRKPYDEDVIERKLSESIDHLRKLCGEAQIDAPFVAARAEVRSLVLDAEDDGHDRPPPAGAEVAAVIAGEEWFDLLRLHGVSLDGVGDGTGRRAYRASGTAVEAGSAPGTTSRHLRNGQHDHDTPSSIATSGASSD